MKDTSDTSNKNENNKVPNNSGVNPRIFLIKKILKDNLNSSNANKKICEYCYREFFSKFNKERHINTAHLKQDLIQDINEQNNIVGIDEGINGIERDDMEKIPENSDNKLLGIKHYSKTNLLNFQGKCYNKNIYLKNDNESFEKNKNHLNCIKPELKSRTIITEKISEFTIFSDNKKNKNNIHDIIVNNIYNILKNNKFLSIEHYFMFQNLIIGGGTYGTVYFGIDIKSAKPVAIKASNEEKRNKTLEVEISLMKKLSKHKLFSKIFDYYILDNKIFLIETLQGPDINKLKNFCGGKFSLMTVYKIGIEILQCLKHIHRIGYLYIDLKDDNIVMILKAIKLKNRINNITLIDYGFCEKYYKDDIDAPRAHGNICYSSINALSGVPVSRKDDIISLCYLLADLYHGYLPWGSISGDLDKKEETIKLKKIYPFRKICGDAAKELLFIYNDVNSLNFSEPPNYENYIYLMENYLKINSGKSQKDILFDWEEKFIKLIKPFEGVENLIEHNSEVSKLFKGYPSFLVKIILENYINK